MHKLTNFLSTIVCGCCAGALLIAHCTLEPVTGGGTEGGNVVAGVVLLSDGSTAAKVKVNLVPSEFNPGLPGQKVTVVTTKTGSDGGYSFANVREGSYSVEAVDSVKGTLSLLTGVAVNSEDVTLAADTLRAPGVVRVYYPVTAGGDKGFIYLPGTTILVRISGDADYEVVKVPAATVLPPVCFGNAAGGDTGVLRYNIEVGSGDTATVAQPGWKYARPITLNTAATGAQVTGTVVNIPVLIRLNSENYVFTQASQGGRDIRFTRCDTVLLPHEIERWDGANGVAEVWVLVDTVFGNNDSQSITMLWGNEQAADSSNGCAVFDTADGYVGVWHMNEAPVAGVDAVKDRTCNANNAVANGAMTATHSLDGVVGKALTFDGVDDYLDAGQVSVPQRYSMGLWVRMDTVGTSQRFIYRDSSFSLWYDKLEPSVRLEHMSKTTWWRGMLQDGGTAVPMSAKNWCYLVGTFDGTAMRLYVNGIEVSVTDPFAVPPEASTFPLIFGRSRNIDYVKGAMDEIRLEGRARGADWIKLSYMNQRPDDKLVIMK